MLRRVLMGLLLLTTASCAQCQTCAPRQSCEECIDRCQGDFPVSREACIAGACKASCPQQP